VEPGARRGPKGDCKVMVRLGIDFGTTRTVVATVDRGNYPVISFQPGREGGETDDDQILNWYPSIVAAKGEEVVYGLDALAKQRVEGWTLLRSFKRQLGEVGPDERIRIGSCQRSAIELLTGFLSQLRLDLLSRSNLRIKPREKMAAMISVPANANSNQRFLTLDAFRRAGFDVKGMINEPTAAGIEYAHLLSQSGGSTTRENLVVYDLGGGTFDSSVINLVERRHEVLSSEGIARLGGDNFDIILLDLALAEARIETVEDDQLMPLLDECRHKKESLHANSRRITIDLGTGIAGGGEVTLTVQQFYEACRPLIESTIEAMETVMRNSAREVGIDLHETAAVYLVGGSSDLPLVSRLLRERYGRHVRRSPFPYAATAIGLAIAADTKSGYRLRERFTRHFGVWREFNDGQQISFDPLFEKETLLPTSEEAPLVRTRRYRPTHNLGHFRYLECSQLDGYGQPKGDLAPWVEVLFPYDPSLQGREGFQIDEVRRLSQASSGLIEETYTCDANGTIEVVLTDSATGHQRAYRLRGRG
jgi:molecular chaperone DnaK (HSP70)